jgi:hypothetical protein
MGSSSSRRNIDFVDPPPMDLRDAPLWSKYDVAKWLSESGYGMYRFKFLKNDIDGPALLELKDHHYDKLGVSIGHSLKIQRIIQKLMARENNHDSQRDSTNIPLPLSFTQSDQTDVSFSLGSSVRRKTSINKNSTSPMSPPSTIVPPQPLSNQEKEYAIQVVIKKMENLKDFGTLSMEEQRTRAKNLVLPNYLLSTYLDLNYVKTKRVIEEETEDAQNQEDDEDNSMFGKKYRNECLNIEEQTIVQAIGRSVLNITEESYLKVKLVIVEIHRTSTQRTIRRVFSPLIDSFGISRYGMFHSALIVGPWYLEWNDSSLVIPRMCYAGAAVIAADVQKYFRGPQVKVAVDRIASVIAHWNSSRHYSSTKDNCQTFIDELCEVLDIQLDFKGALGQFLQTLRKTGQCEPTYSIQPSMQNLLGLPFATCKFESHRDLDNFVNLVRSKMPTYFEMDPIGQDDWHLLKSFDRAYWLRRAKESKNPDYAPHECPFNDPELSGSLTKDVFTYKKKLKHN